MCNYEEGCSAVQEFIEKKILRSDQLHFKSEPELEKILKILKQCDAFSEVESQMLRESYAKG